MAGAGIILAVCARGQPRPGARRLRARAPARRCRSVCALLAGIDTENPDDLTVRLICDHYGTHKHSSITALVGQHP